MFAVENIKENIRAIFVYIAANFRISNRIEYRENFRIFEYESNIRPIFRRYLVFCVIYHYHCNRFVLHGIL